MSDSETQPPVDVLTTPDVMSSIGSESIAVPDDPYGEEDDDKRLWVGNLDSRVTEFAVLKLVQKFGSIRKMDFIYHRAGPDKGKSKGYCFVSFHTWEAAERARKSLDGKLVLSRPIYVKWAQGSRQSDPGIRVISKSKSQPAKESSSSSSSAASSSISAPVASAVSHSTSLEETSTEAKIQAIEAKLRLMEQTQKDFSIDAVIKPPPGFKPITATHRQDIHPTRPAPYRKTHSHSSTHRQKRR